MSQYINATAYDEDTDDASGCTLTVLTGCLVIILIIGILIVIF
jgi:hypothetical protein